MNIRWINLRVSAASLILFCCACVLLLGASAVCLVYQVPLIDLTRDIQTLGNVPFYFGTISTLGIVLWAITGSICLFSAALLWKMAMRFDAYFLLSASFISFYVFSDDYWLIHEHSGDWLRGGEKAIELILGAAVFLHIFFFRKSILKTELLVLMAALGFLALSVAADSLQPYLWEKGNWHTLAEDGTKWFGISCWCIYYSKTSFQLLLKKLNGGCVYEN